MEDNRPNFFSILTKTQKIYFGILCAALVALLLLAGKFLNERPAETPAKAIPAEYAGLTLEARAAYVLDAKKGESIFSLNGEAQLPLASLTKVMMAITALSILPENSIVTIKPEALLAEGDSGLYGYEKWRLNDLLNLTLIESSNDGSNAIAEKAGQMASVINATAGPSTDSFVKQFVSEMNKKTRELGLTQTYFLNPTGLDETVYVSGGYGSAKDVSKMLFYAISNYPRLFEGTIYNSRKFQSASSMDHLATNTNGIVDKLPSLLASKTGYTDLAGGNLTIAFDAGPGRPIIVSVLGSTEQGRFTDAEKLIWATIDYLNGEQADEKAL
jgi:D-alanyl-D-alanine carboxypeptidase